MGEKWLTLNSKQERRGVGWRVDRVVDPLEEMEAEYQRLNGDEGDAADVSRSEPWKHC